MTGSRLTRIAREGLLTSAAVLGVLCIVLTSLGLLFGVRPLLFRSGSMSPTIQTGDLSLARTVAAADLRPGDVVSVMTADGQRVTHRVVTTSYVGGATRELTLKGDANKTPDTQVYDVTSAQRVMFTLPKAGYVVNWFSTMPGVLVLVAYVLGMLLLASGRRITISGGGSAAPTAEVPPAMPAAEHAEGSAPIAPGAEPAEPPAPASCRRRRIRAVVGVAVVGVAVVAVAGWALPTWAAWTSNVAVTNTSFTASTGGTLPSPAPISCVNHTVSGTFTFTWTASTGATSYTLSYFIGSNGTPTPRTGLTGTTFTTSDAVKINGGHQWTLQAIGGWSSSTVVTSTTCTTQNN